MATRQSQTVRKVEIHVTALDAQAIHDFSAYLLQQNVRPSAPVDVRVHEGQRGEPQGATLTATEIN